MSKLGKDKSVKKTGWENLIWWILVLVINLYMMIMVIGTTYNFRIPFIVAFPWFLAAFMAKDKRSRIRAALVFGVAFIIHYAVWIYDIFFIVNIEDFFRQNAAIHTTIWIREIFWGGLIVYALRIRKEVSEKIELARGGRKKVVKNVDKVTTSKNTQLTPVEKEETKPEPIVQPEKLDINKCSESDFITLPGMSLSLAKKAVENREQNGNYESFDDFVARNGIKPHFMVQMEDRIMVVKKEELKSTESIKRSRTLDL